MRSGRLEVIYGPMFSGKSRELIRRLEESGRAGARVAAFKSHLDVRHDADCISSHDGLRYPCHPIQRGDEIREAGLAADVIGIDEAQFFGEELVDSCLALVDSGKRVIVAGLHEDYRGLPFEPIPTLIRHADEAYMLIAVCAVCGAGAVHTHRIIPVGERVVVGARETYEARCSRCFDPPRGSA